MSSSVTDGLPERLVLGVHRLGAGQVQHRPEQHRGMAVRQHEAVAIGPDRVLRIEAHDAVPERVDQRRERHRRAGMAGLGLLHRVHGERADRVDRTVDRVLRWSCHATELAASALKLRGYPACFWAGFSRWPPNW